MKDSMSPIRKAKDDNKSIHGSSFIYETSYGKSNLSWFARPLRDDRYTLSYGENAYIAINHDATLSTGKPRKNMNTSLFAIAR